MKSIKSISINPKILIEIEDLIESGRIASFSHFAENAIETALKDFRIS